MAEENKCQHCGAELPANAPGGVCPKCVMKLGLPTGVDPEKSQSQGDQHAVPTSATPPGGGFVPPEPAELAEKLPGLEILELLGHGGMGAVYKARQKQLDRIVALKVLPVEISKDPAFAERFTREARSLARLNHPHIVTVYDFGRSDDLYYFIMEFVDGTDLRQVIRAGDLAPDQALAIVPQICEALQYAHEEGIVHRDIKPENIFLDKKGRVKIGDFGLAKILNKPATAFTLTQPQQRMGTPHYMAPEQIEGASNVDHRADIYSLGVVFYEMLTGQLPIGRFPPPSRKVQVDVRLDNVVLRSLEHEPERRYQHASEIKTDVESIAVDAGHQEPAGKPTETEHESAEQFILSQLPTTRIGAVKAYQKKTGAGRTEAALAIDAMMRKHGIKFTPVPLKLGRLLAAAAALIVYYVLYILFRRHVEISSTLGWSVMALFCVAVFVFFSVAAWRSRSIDKGLQFRLFVGFFLFLFLLNPLAIVLIKPTLILKRLYSLTGADPGLHDALFLRIVVGAIIAGGLYWLLRLWLQYRANRKVAADLDLPTGNRAAYSKPDNRTLVIAVIAIAGVMLGLLVSLAVMYFAPGGRFYDRRGPVTRTGSPSPGSETVPMTIGGMDMPFGTWDYVEYGPTGPVLSDQCAETLDLKPSELLAANEAIQGAYKKYLELEAAHTNRQRIGDSLKVTITPFREQALPILEQLWADLDNVLDTRKQGIARRHLPLGRIFAVLEFEFGGPTMKFTFDKKGGAYDYKITRDWPEGSGKRDGGRSGRALALPPEYQRFWDEPAADK